MQTIENLKNQPFTETPLFLFECKFASGAVEHWSSHAVTVDGQSYRARVLGHNVFEWKLSADEGADTGSKISLTLANADSYLSVLERMTGFKGAQLTVRFVFFALKEGTAASESRVIFRGIAGSPDEITESSVRVSFTNRLSLLRVALPQIRIQKRCPWAFPMTPEQRQEAVTGGARADYSPYYRCGYSPDIPGGCGNFSTDGKPYTSCSYTKADCVLRGMYDKDASDRTTRRFGGIQFVPSTIAVRGYGEKDWHSSAVQTNEAKYNDVVPMLYGAAWYGPPIVCSRNDGNLTRMEVLLGVGEVQRVIKVVVNDYEIPEGVTGANMTATGWYQLVTPGTRNGEFNPDFADASGNPVGDPYGSMAMMSVVVPNRISNGQSLPKIQVLADGLKLDRYNVDGSPAGKTFTNNPAWVLLDILRRCGWSLEDMDVPSFAKSAQYLEEPVPAKDLHGNPTSIPRFQCNLPLQRRRSAADLVRGVRNGSMVLLSYAPGGKLQLRVEGDLASQQNAKPAGSNSTEALSGGWPAYEFSDGTRPFSGILRRESGEPWFRIWSRGTSETVNRLSLEFQDQFNEYQQDSLSLLDLDDVDLTGQELNGSIAALGVANFDQAARVLSLALQKSIQGNVYVEFGTSVRAFGLTPGDLIAITYEKEAFDRMPFRVVRIAPTTNFRTAVITAQVHDDAWYSAPDLTHPGGRRLNSGSRVPRPLIGAVLDDNEVPQFKIEEKPREAADGTPSVVLTVEFHAPGRVQAVGLAAPVLSLTPVIHEEGGTLAAGTYYYALSGLDPAGAEGPLSFSVRAAVAGESKTNTVQLRDISVDAGTTALNVYRGKVPASLVRIAASVAVDTEFIDDGSHTPELIGPPDPNYDHANFYWRLELQPETRVSSQSANSVTGSALSMTANQFRGAIVRITAGKGAGQERPVIANEETSLTVAPEWDIEPDESSSFCVAEASWKFGALTVDGPAEFEVPNRKNATVHISGRSANVRDEECPAEISPLTRWRIGGCGGADADIPPVPAFGLYAPGAGKVEVMSISFTDLTNTHTVTAGTLTLYYENELKPPVPGSLASPLDDATTELVLDVPVKAGDVLRVENEIISVNADAESGECSFTRGSHGSVAVAHEAGTKVYILSRRVQIVPFADDFFGSPASGDYTHSFDFSDVRIWAAELFVTNSHGSGLPKQLSFTTTTEGGLRTLSGGQYSIQIDGFVAAEANAAPAIVVETSHAVRDVYAVVSSAPAGGPISLLLKMDGSPYCGLTIPDGATASDIIPGTTLLPLTDRAKLTLEVVSVPQGKDNFPGRDLSVSIRL